MVGGGLDELCFTLKHLVETSGKLLWDAPLPRSRIVQRGNFSAIVAVRRIVLVLGSRVVIIRHGDG